ncbi:DUF4817 domain-containing protein [Trichonephila clavipes]|nr:DUF4817 domain-containing protein [Trichonephila clavipes]
MAEDGIPPTMLYTPAVREKSITSGIQRNILNFYNQLGEENPRESMNQLPEKVSLRTELKLKLQKNGFSFIKTNEGNIRNSVMKGKKYRPTAELDQVHESINPAIGDLEPSPACQPHTRPVQAFAVPGTWRRQNKMQRFVEWAQNEIAVVPDFHKRILFSDEAHFWLKGYVNKQNCRICSEANPQVYVETPLHSEKLTVWCALWAGGIIGPYFFKNDEGHNVTVNGDRYRAMITNFFIPELNNHDVQELWFQQDGATCHTARATIDLLKDTFGKSVNVFDVSPSNCDADPSSLENTTDTPRCTTVRDDRRFVHMAVDGSRSHITSHSTTDSVYYASFGVNSYPSTSFAAEWNVHQASIASFTLDWKSQAFAPPMMR